MSKDAETPPSGGQFLVYQTQDGKLKIDVRFEGETVWLTQQHMAELFQTTQKNISLHLHNIYAEGELQLEATHKESLSVRQEGTRSVRRRVDFYNLDAILSVGYRVKSAVATRFRIWATRQLREYIVKGFLLDDERLKNPDQPFDYFEELMRRIQDIRTSERRFYQKITDIYATSIDCDPTQEESLLFFKAVQNKVHWAVTGQTAAEIIHNLVEQYLIFAQGQAMRRVPMHVADWIEKLNGFLTLNDRDILTHAGRISHEMAQAKAELEYDKFKALEAGAPRPVDADFEQATKDLKKLPRPKNPKEPKK